MKLLLEKLSRYWQLRFLAVAAGVALVVYAVLLPVHDNDGTNSSIESVSASQLRKGTQANEPTPVLVGAGDASASSANKAGSPASWLQANQAAVAQLNLAADAYQQSDIPRDFSESTRQLRRAANTGSAAAQILLGHAYEPRPRSVQGCVGDGAVVWPERLRRMFRQAGVLRPCR